MESQVKFCLVILLFSLPTATLADRVSDEDDLQTAKQTLPSNALMAKVVENCPLILSSALLYDVKKQFNSTQIVPFSIFIDVFRLAAIDDLSRR